MPPKFRNPHRFAQNRQTLPDASYDSRVTDMSRPLMPPNARNTGPNGQPIDTFRNRTISATTPFSIIANAPSVRALPYNPRRVGLQIQNLDSTNILRYSLGNDLNVSGLYVVALGTVLYDFTTPPDELWLASTTNIQCIVLEMTRGFSISGD